MSDNTDLRDRIAAGLREARKDGEPLQVPAKAPVAAGTAEGAIATAVTAVLGAGVVVLNTVKPNLLSAGDQATIISVGGGLLVAIIKGIRKFLENRKAAAAVLLMCFVVSVCGGGCASARSWALDHREVVQVAIDRALVLISERQLGPNTREKACLVESGIVGASTFGLLAREEITGVQRMQMSVAAACAFAERTFPDALNGRSLGRLAIDRLGLSGVSELLAVEGLIEATIRVK